MLSCGHAGQNIANAPGTKSVIRLGLHACDCGGPAIPGKCREAPGNVSASQDLSACRLER